MGVVNGNLPDGWTTSTLAEASEVILGQSPTSDTYNIDGIGLPFYQGKAEFGDLYPTTVKWCSDPGKIAEAGDILISVRAPVGPTNLCQEKSCIGRGLAALRPKSGMPTKYLLYYLRLIEQEWDSKATGTTFKAITGDVLRHQEIPIAPLSEQERIVAKIEELFTQLEAGTAALKRVRAGLKRYKASVLKAAFTGKLIMGGNEEENAGELLKRIMSDRQEHWKAKMRARGKDPKKLVYEELQAPNAEELAILPENWTWATWEMILAHEDGAFRRGPFGSTLTKSIFVKSGYKVYEQYCPINDDCSFVRYYITPELFEELKSFEVKDGDYLISCSGVTLGRITRVPENSEKGIINQALLRVRINDKIIDHKYFVHYFRSPFFQERLFDSSTGTAIPNVKGVKELKALPFPLPPLAEQRRIVAEVERRLSVAQEVETVVAASVARAARLRQSVLKSAFEGNLA
jgi:type I restriction enzyme S subunit